MLYLIYILLVLGFLALGALIVRYLLRFGHLAPRFKWAVTLFGGLALASLILSFYLLSQLNNPSGTLNAPFNQTIENGSFDNDLNF